MAVFHFNCKKTVQAVAFLLSQPGTDGDAYLKVIKLLYLADRESLLETGRPITGDKTVAMPHGTALSHATDLIRGQDFREEWSEFLATGRDKKLRIVKDPGQGLLCRYELDKLSGVARRYRRKTRWDMKDITHRLPEYRKNHPGQSSKEIPISDILEAGGKSDMLPSIKRAARSDLAFARAFGA